MGSKVVKVTLKIKTTQRYTLNNFRDNINMAGVSRRIELGWGVLLKQGGTGATKLSPCQGMRQ